MKFTFSQSERGVVMIAILVLILVGMVVGFAMMMTSRTSIKLSADFRGKTSLYYRAEEGINKTLAHFIRNEDWGKLYVDGGFDKYTGPVTCDTAENPMVPSDSSGDPDSIRCRFLRTANLAEGITVDDDDKVKFKLQVMVSRRPDHCKNGFNLASLDPVGTKCEDNGDITDGQVYLVNSVATDKSGRQEVAQGVIIIPMLRTVVVEGSPPTTVAKTVRHPYLSPYLAALVRGSAHKAPAAPTP